MLCNPKHRFMFVLARIMPLTHQTEITKDKVALVYEIMTEKMVDLVNIIHGSIMGAGVGLATVALPCLHTIIEL